MGRTLQPEDVIAHYRVIGPLGAGGMGEVYRAYDTKLERDVALKVLPAELVQSGERVKRFILEARSASSLSHPHIVTIYEIGHEKVQGAGEAEPSGDDVHYIAMELVRGKTVHDLIHKEKVDLKTMLGYLAQSAEGLSKAHGAGIVHRDLKPGNIMVNNDGYAKVLDFGLAKLTEKETTTADDLTRAPTEVRTGVGVVVGTVGYMSPEQVQGKSVDHRSDVFSFGCILYEAATGAHPFVGESSIDTMHRIVHESPRPIDEINQAAPAALRRLIKRCLAKNPDQRLQSIKDLALELREIVDEFDTLSATATSSSGTAHPALAPRRSAATTTLIVAVVLLGLAGVAFGVWSLLGGRGDDASTGRQFRSMRMSRLMSGADVVGGALSRDGRYLAYIKGPAGQWSLWVRQVATGSDVPILAPQTVQIRGVSFSPDGNYLYYLGRDPDTPDYSALFEVPSLGGTPTKRLFDIDSAITFSPDGKRVAFIRRVPNMNQDHLVVADLDSGQENVLAMAEAPDEIHTSKPAWSPDGARIVVHWHGWTERGTRHGLVAFDASSGQREEVTEPDAPSINSLAWLPDGSGLIATTSPGSGLSPQIVFIPYPGGPRLQITNDLDGYRDVSVSAEGSSIAAVRMSSDSGTWLVPVHGEDAARQVTPRSSTDRIFNLVFLEGNSVGFTARKDQHAPIWVMSEDGSARRQVTSQAGWSWALSPLPDGRGIVFNHSSEAERIQHVWRVNADGGNLRQITDGLGEFLIALSPDGTTVLFTRTESPDELWRVTLDGGEPERFLGRFGGNGAFSPDGRLFLYSDLEEVDGRQRDAYFIIPAAGGSPLARFLPPGGAFDTEWYVDGSALTYIDTVDGVQNLWRQPADGSEPVQLTSFSEGRITDQEHAPDGSRIALTRNVDAVQNVWTIEPDGTNPTQTSNFSSGQIFDTEWARDGGKMIVLQGDVRREVVLLER